MLVHHLIYGAASCLLLLLAAAVLALYDRTGLAAALAVVSLAAPCWLMRAFLRYVCFANLRFGAALLLDLLGCGLQIAALAGLWLVAGLTGAAALAAMGAASALACGAWWLARPGIRFRPVRADVLPDWQRNWRFARWALASQLIGCSTSYILPWILAHAHGEAATGMFAASVNLCGLAMMLVVGVAHSLTPQASRAFVQGGIAELRRLLNRTFLLFGVTLGLFCLAMMLVGDALVTTIYGPPFAGSGPVVAMLALAVMATGFAVAGGNGLWAVDRPQANLVADAVCLMVTLSAAWLYVGRLGVLGAALATVLGNAAGAFVRLVMLHWVLRAMSRGQQLAPQV